MKKKILLGVLFVLLPFINVNAASVSASLNCKKVVLSPGEKTTCTLDGKVSDGSISGFQSNINFDDNIKITNFAKGSDFNGSVDIADKFISLDTEGEEVSGEFNIGTIYITAGDKANVTSNITFSNSILSVDTVDNVVDQSVTIAPVSIKIASNDNSLKDLKINGKTIEGFSSTKEQYDIELSSSSVNISATANNSGAKVTGDIGDKKLSYGSNKFTITVTAETGAIKKYILYIDRPEVREIKSITMNGDKHPVVSGVYSFTKEYKKMVNSIVFDLELVNDNDASFVSGFGPRTVDNLDVGKNQVLFKTVDKDGNVLTYTINVNILSDDKVETTDDNKDDNNDDSTINKDDNNVDKDSNTNDKKDESVKNPSTGVNVSIILSFGTLLMGFVIYIILKKKNYFKKI